MPRCRFALVAICLSLATGLTASEAAIERGLVELDRRFDPCFAWWAQVYDPATGGCFYSRSGKAARDAGEPGFGPDIEATSKLLRVLAWSDLVDELAEPVRTAAVGYFQQRQDPASGFFRDPQFGPDDYSHNTLSRALGMSVTSLAALGAAPLYPLPDARSADNAEAAAFRAHLASPEAFLAYLDQLPWQRRIWTVGGNLRAQAGAVHALPVPLRSAILDAAEAELIRRQHADGYWGRPDSADGWASRLSGSYKIAAFLQANGRAIPQAETLRDHVLRDLFERDYHGLIVCYNTVNVLTMLQREGLAYDDRRKLAILERAIAILDTMRAPDGGFCTIRDRPKPEANGKRLGKPVVEANTNATGLAHKTRMLLIELCTGEPGPHPHPRGGDLLQALTAAAVTEATTPITGSEEATP